MSLWLWPARWKPTYGAMQTDEASPVYRYAKRAFFIIHRNATVKFAKVMDNSLDLLSADEFSRRSRTREPDG